MKDLTQKSLVLIKPDALERNLIGEIVSRFEKVGLRVVDAKMVNVTKELATNHYPGADEAWLTKVGNNTISDCEKYGFDVKETMGTDDAIELGKLIHSWNIAAFDGQRILAFVFEGVHAIEVIRKITGSTLPLLAAPGTIRGDLSSASAISENIHQSAIRNLVHASGDPEEAEREIELWFGK